MSDERHFAFKKAQIENFLKEEFKKNLEVTVKFLYEKDKSLSVR